MSRRRRLAAWMVLMLQLTLGLRPFADRRATTDHANTTPHHVQAPEDAHANAHANAHGHGNGHGHGHAPHKQQGTESERSDGPSSSHDHLNACHATPCCAPTVPHGAVAVPHDVLVIAFVSPSSVPAAPRFPAASDHRQPPSTPPPSPRA